MRKQPQLPSDNQEYLKDFHTRLLELEAEVSEEILSLREAMKKMNSNRLLVSDEMSAEFRIRRTQQNLLRNEIAKIEMQIYPSHLKMRI